MHLISSQCNFCRWQRRWFVLYDDGEFCYSMYDHPDTIPQAVINLNTVHEITGADVITGNKNSIDIVVNDGSIHFVKGTCYEESRLWLDILRLFPQVRIVLPQDSMTDAIEEYVTLILLFFVSGGRGSRCEPRGVWSPCWREVDRFQWTWRKG